MRAVAHQMGEALQHRGPDDEGVWVDERAGVAFAHRRLSVLDLSADGHQPMVSLGGRYVISYNGEIYNFRAMRRELEKKRYSFKGHSDTEVLLAAIEAWGVEPAMARTVGMFAFALWDRQDGVLTLARDRLGEKPLYYGWHGRAFLFGSELKALKQYTGWSAELDRDALVFYLRHNYIPAPYSIYRGIYKLLPGTLLQMTVDSRPDVVPDPRPFWRLSERAQFAKTHPFTGSSDACVDSLDALLRRAVGERMVSDVPLGGFLSGGIDSSTIVALMQAQNTQPIKTFAIGFQETGYDEAQYARLVAKHLGTEHTELYVTPRQALDVIPHLPTLYDEPFSDASQIPSYLLAKMTQNQVTVALSGDGGDELFAGYTRYFWLHLIRRRLERIPLPMRRTLARGIQAVSPSAWNSVFSVLSPVLPGWGKVPLPGDKLHKLAGIVALRNSSQMYRGLLSQWPHPEEAVLNGCEPVTPLSREDANPDLPELFEFMMSLDLATYLPDDILVKLDRAAMGVGLETRAPFLDHRVVEFALSIPLSMKVRAGHGKWILRQVLKRYVPDTLTERPKMGFGVPVGAWLRGPLRDWAEALLTEPRLRNEGVFDPVPIRKKWAEHLSGTRNWQYALWNVLVFQAWLDVERQSA